MRVDPPLPELTPIRAALLEDDFLSRLEARIGAAESFPLPAGGGCRRGRARRDDGFPRDRGDEIRRMIAEEGIHDARLIEEIPRGGRIRYLVRRKGFLSHRAEMTILAGVVHPWRAFLRGLPPAPRDAGEAAGLLPPGEEEPVVATVLSTSGWRRSGNDPESSPVFLVEPAPSGGYRLFEGPGDRLPPYLAPEDDGELRERVVRFVGEARVDLVLHGLELAETSRRTGAPAGIVRESFLSLAAEEEFLRVSREAGTLVLRRA